MSDNLLIVQTRNSVYAVRQTASAAYVEGRITFDPDGYLPTDRQYTGQLVSPLVEGQRLQFIDPEFGIITTSVVLAVIGLVGGRDA